MTNKSESRLGLTFLSTSYAGGEKDGATNRSVRFDYH